MKPIPDNAEKVFSGIIFDTYQWQQEMYDGSFVTYEKIKRKGTVMLLPITDEGKIILAKQSQPGMRDFIGLLGGKVDAGEDHETAGKRELLEEAGIKANKLELLWDHTNPDSKLVWDIRTHIARELEFEKVVELEAGEKVQLMELTFDEFVELVIFDDNFRDLEVKYEVMQVKLKGELDDLKEKLLND